MVGQPLTEIRKRMPNADTRVAAIFRRNRPILPEGNTVIETDDDVFFIAARENVEDTDVFCALTNDEINIMPSLLRSGSARSR